MVHCKITDTLGRNNWKMSLGLLVPRSLFKALFLFSFSFPAPRLVSVIIGQKAPRVPNEDETTTVDQMTCRLPVNRKQNSSRHLVVEARHTFGFLITPAAFLFLFIYF